MWRSISWLVVLTACSAGSSTLNIHGSVPFDRIELFFVTKDAPVTDMTKLPQTTNTIDTPISSPSTMWLRDYHGGEDPPDIWTGSARSAIELGIPNRIDVGTYVGVVATMTGSATPVAVGQVTEFSNDGAVTYDVPLTALREGAAPVGSAVPATLSGLHWLSPCKTTSITTCADGPTITDAPVPIAGTPGDTFIGPAGSRGVMQVNKLPAAVVIGGLTTGTPSTAANAFELVVSNPASTTTYILNGAAYDGRVQPWDYTATFSVAAGDSISFVIVNAITADQQTNLDANSVPFELPGVVTPTDPYTGQFARLDVVDVTRVPNANVTTWPSGVDVWTAPGSDQACLRATIDGTTNFVVTAGNVDCDSFVDSADCDPRRYCDPTVPSPGCSSACSANVKGQCMSGTCVDSYGETDRQCAIDPDKPSYCMACDSACDPDPSIDDRQRTFDCIDTQMADDLCNYGVLNGTTPCPTAIVVSFNTSCDSASVLSTDAGFPVTASVSTVTPCTVNLSVDLLAAFTAANHEVMLGLETMTGGFDTVTVQLVPAFLNTTTDCTQQPPCANSPTPHDCSMN